MFRKILVGVMCGAALIGLLAGPALPVAAQAGALAQLLALVPDTPASRTELWYGSLADLNESLGVQVNSREDVDKLSQQQQFDYLYEIGQQVYYSPFSGLARAPEWQATFGINSFAVARELTVGKEPEQFAILQGNFDVNAVANALSELGYQPAQVGGATIFALGGDNAMAGGAVGQMAGARYNRLFVTPNQIVAAPSTALIQSVLGGGQNLRADPSYAALAAALEGANVVPNTRLLSAALFDGTFLSRALGATGQNPPLPPYQAAGIGYRRGADERAVVFALVYADPNAAAQAGEILLARLNSYVSSLQPGKPVFSGWQFDVQVREAGGVQVAVVAGRISGQTDVAWVKMVQERDIAFLATR